MGETSQLEKEEAPEEMALPSLGEPYRPFLAYSRRNPGDNFISELIEATFTDVTTGEDRHLSDAEILNYVGMLNAAGNETTTRLIGWTAKVLAENPEQLAELGADRSLIPNAVEEMLRYESPSPIQSRVTTKDVELHGQTIPEGSIVSFLTGAANRDERRFEEPDKYDIHREIGHHVAFGYGVHYCFGAALARIEGRIALEEILDRFPTWGVDMANAEMIHTSTTRGYSRLPIVL